MTVEVSKDVVTELFSILQSNFIAFLFGLVLGGGVVFFLTCFYYKKVANQRLLNQLDEATKKAESAEKERNEYKVRYQQLLESTKDAYDYIYAKNAIDEKSNPYSTV